MVKYTVLQKNQCPLKSKHQTAVQKSSRTSDSSTPSLNPINPLSLSLMSLSVSSNTMPLAG